MIRNIWISGFSSALNLMIHKVNHEMAIILRPCRPAFFWIVNIMRIWTVWRTCCTMLFMLWCSSSSPHPRHALKHLRKISHWQQRWIRNYSKVDCTAQFSLPAEMNIKENGWTTRSTVRVLCLHYTVCVLLCFTVLWMGVIKSIFFQGKGTQIWRKSGAIYDGEWKYGKYDGYGTYSVLLPDTKEYTKNYCGEWKNGKKHVCAQ